MAIVLNQTIWVASNSNVANAYTFYIEVEEGTPSIQTNKSPITINVYAKGNNGFSYNGFTAPYVAIKLDGTSLGTTKVPAISSTKTRIASKSIEVLHNDDGSKTIGVQIQYAEAETSYLPKPFTSSTFDATLTTIARASNLSLAYNSMVNGDNKEQVVSLTHYAQGFYWKPVVIYKGAEIYRYSGLYGVDTTTLNTFTQEWIRTQLGATYSGTATFTIVIETYTDSTGSVLVGSNQASFTYTMGAIALSLYQNGDITGVAFGKEATGEGIDFTYQNVDFTNANVIGLSGGSGNSILIKDVSITRPTMSSKSYQTISTDITIDEGYTALGVISANSNNNVIAIAGAYGSYNSNGTYKVSMCLVVNYAQQSAGTSNAKVLCVKTS